MLNYQNMFESVECLHGTGNRKMNRQLEKIKSQKERVSASSWSKHTVSPIVFPCQMCMLARATTGMTGWWRGERHGLQAHADTHTHSWVQLCASQDLARALGCEGGDAGPGIGWNMVLCICVCVWGSCSLHAPGSVVVTRQAKAVCLHSSAPRPPACYTHTHTHAHKSS